MMKSLTLSSLAALTFGLVAAPAFAGQHANAAAGETAWRSCRSCHAITDPAGTVIQRGGRSGPNLFGLPGRAVASVEGFNYSAPLTQYAATGAVWTEELFVEYMANPTAFLREKLDDDSVRSPMSFRMRSGAEDMWAYLESVSPDSE
jgi:cytochrome c